MDDTMPGKSTLSPEWRALIKEVGSIKKVQEALGLSESTFSRIRRGISRFPPECLAALQVLCDMYDVDNPIASTPKAREKDLGPLRMLGNELSKGLPPAARTIERLREVYPEKQLLELAESEGTPENILRAVTLLLEK